MGNVCSEILAEEQEQIKPFLTPSATGWEVPAPELGDNNGGL